MNLNYAAITNLTIAGVSRVYSKPYLLDFQFTLRDSPTPGAGNPVVRPISQLQVVCLEDDGVQIQPIPAETTFIADRGNKKQLKTFLVLDYTFSMFVVPGAIDQMQIAAKTLINLEPATAQFGIYEFHADYVDPQLVTTNGFTSDKAFLGQAIDGIQDNYVQGNYAGTRAFDAIHNAISKFGPFSATNRDEQRYVVVMTDGNDDSSLLNTNADPINVLIKLAQTNQVRVFCVAFGPDINTNALQRLTSQTLGRYYEAATTADLPDQFLKIVKDIDGQYILRWATLKRAPKFFQPSFQVTVDGFTAAQRFLHDQHHGGYQHHARNDQHHGHQHDRRLLSTGLVERCQGGQHAPGRRRGCRAPNGPAAGHLCATVCARDTAGIPRQLSLHRQLGIRRTRRNPQRLEHDRNQRRDKRVHPHTRQSQPPTCSPAFHTEPLASGHIPFYPDVSYRGVQLFKWTTPSEYGRDRPVSCSRRVISSRSSVRRAHSHPGSIVASDNFDGC